MWGARNNEQKRLMFSDIPPSVGTSRYHLSTPRCKDVKTCRIAARIEHKLIPFRSMAV